jgi:hypothetical protein
MLLQLLVNQPQAIGRILSSTPTWVWGLLAALVALGMSQARDRQMSLLRVALMPVAMGVFALWGIVSSFGAAGQLATVLGAWLVAAVTVGALVGMSRTPAGTRYDAAARRFAQPGSWVPLALILGIFLTKYAVGVELALAPRQAHDIGFAVAIAALYGVFNGLFTGRALRLLRLAFRPAPLSIANA